MSIFDRFRSLLRGSQTPAAVPPLEGLSWTDETLALRKRLEAAFPELAPFPFLYAVENDDFAVHLRWDHAQRFPERPESGRRTSMAYTTVFRRDGARYWPVEHAGGVGTKWAALGDGLMGWLHDAALQRLPAPLTHAADYLPVAVRPAGRPATALPDALYEAAPMVGLDVGPLRERIGGLPNDYVSFARRWGAATVNGFVRVHAPREVLDQLDAERLQRELYFFWDRSADVLDKRDSVGAVQLADTLDGDIFVAVPANPEWTFFLPRNDDRVEVHEGFWTAVGSVVRRRATGVEGLLYVEPTSGARHGRAVPIREDASDGEELLCALNGLGVHDARSTMNDLDSRTTTLFVPALAGRVAVSWLVDDNAGPLVDQAVGFLVYAPTHHDSAVLSELEDVFRAQGYLVEWSDPERA
ncbi:MAG: hypothetical protein H6726_30500 [Sandaracinaceae bacterium]|nr:hypothetical protein [Sandaracinaceae bacterium]